jgi:hypothetical protein
MGGAKLSGTLHGVVDACFMDASSDAGTPSASPQVEPKCLGVATALLARLADASAETRNGTVRNC